MNVEKVLKESKGDLIGTYDFIKSHGNFPKKGMEYKHRVMFAGIMGANISAVTKRTKIRAFLAYAEALAETEADVMTMTVGTRLAKELLGRSINKADLMLYFTTTRTAADKVDVKKVVENILNSQFTQTWVLQYEDLMRQWQYILNDEKDNFNEWKDAYGY
jgi:succinyl-CoA synthetase alpha subunit